MLQSEPIRMAYRVTTDRLLLRCWSLEDAPRLRESIDTSYEHLRPWIPSMKEEPRTLDQTIEVLRRDRAHFDTDQYFRFAIFNRDESTLLGDSILLRRVGPNALEVGYWMDVRHIGNGYMKEAVAALLRVAFDIAKVQRVELHCVPANSGSIALAQSLGFALEATLKARFTSPVGEVQDLMYWSLYAEDIASSPLAKVRYTAFDALGREILSHSS